MNKRINLFQNFAENSKLMIEMDKNILKSGIPPLYIELIKIRASQINGCAYCIDKHIVDALKMGEDQRKINVLGAWHEAKDWFTEEETIVIRLTEEVTLITQNGISNEVFEKGVKLFGEEKFSNLIMAAISINSWNRVGVGLHLHPTK
ncbi:carboxymuconolactone decarboxylase family protein [Chryseobacterium sp. SIMBA_038]|uniref:carboxymuconolactone decarboxylase family protein n=1 Tax=Chryseobacterium sp. SIMBA_038 TaxID=3085780 RepID=UPI00397C697E